MHYANESLEEFSPSSPYSLSVDKAWFRPDCGSNTSMSNLSASLFSPVCANKTASLAMSYRYPDVRPVTIALYLVAFAFGMTGNTLVIYVIGKYKKIRQRSVSNFYIWNLAFADILFIVTLPFFCFTTYGNSWPFGSFACKLLTVFRESNKFASVLTLVALSIDRFLATFHQFGHFRQIKCGIIACVMIWLICLVMSTPYWLFADVVPTKDNRYSCKIRWPNLEKFSAEDFRRLWTYVQLSIGLLVPFSIIATFSILLLRRMRIRSETGAGAASGAGARPTRTSLAAGPVSDATATSSAEPLALSRLKRRHQAQNSMTRVVLVIVVTFGVCHLPYHVNEVVANWIVSMNLTQPYVISALIYFNVVAQMLVFAASCSNPIIYGVLNKNYRALYKQSLFGCCPCFKPTSSLSATNATNRAPIVSLQKANGDDSRSKARARATNAVLLADTAPTIAAADVETSFRNNASAVNDVPHDVVESTVNLVVHQPNDQDDQE